MNSLHVILSFEKTANQCKQKHSMCSQPENTHFTCPALTTKTSLITNSLTPPALIKTCLRLRFNPVRLGMFTVPRLL